MNKEDVLFPHEHVREVQNLMIDEIVNAIKEKKNMIVHAPTGIGKTVSVLAPSLAAAIKGKLTVFFLTSRHTQHEIALRTLKDIKQKFKNSINAVDMIGKKWMCLQAVENLYSNEFAEYCKKLREEEQCEFYTNVKNKGKVTAKGASVLADIKKYGPIDSEEAIAICRNDRLCPYEISSLLCRDANVIIGDYYHIFNNHIREMLFKKAGLELQRCIIIVDEGHNLPARIRNLMTLKLSTVNIERAIKEAKKHGYAETVENLAVVSWAFNQLGSDLRQKNQEKLVRKEELIDNIEKKKSAGHIIKDLIFIGEGIRKNQKQSFVGSVGFFLEQWQGQDEGFARIISYKEGFREPNIILSYICMDPGLYTKEVIEKAYSTIIMSGTLTPTSMYKDILGFSNSVEKTFGSPFPEKNRLNLIIPDTTTKYSRRSEEEYKKIADYCIRIINIVPGNSIVFFPSYDLRDRIFTHIHSRCEKNAFLEKPNMSKEEKLEMLKEFSKNYKTGAVILGVAAGSFGEGIDLPGDLLKAVIVVGLPLEKPNLEIKELISYYDNKFGRGWDYGYIFPAIIKVLQNAGRCIRTEKDRGVIVFLDERFATQNYLRCFPPDMEIKITKLFEDRVRAFFQCRNQ